MKATTLGNMFPTINLAINKCRMKLYNKNDKLPIYYLNNKQEFQLEFFNPLQNNILAKIILNNIPINNGLVIRPGERIFLDRFLESNKKFIFDTYNISGTNVGKNAIKNNGIIKIKFFNEFISYTYPTYQTDYWFGGYDTGLNFDVTTNNSTNSIGISNTSNTLTNTNGNCNFTNTIETGRVSKGSHSTQKLNDVDIIFNSFSFFEKSYKLLPLSQKNIGSSDLIKKYCMYCGGKIKKNNKFCPNCGKKQ